MGIPGYYLAPKGDAFHFCKMGYVMFNDRKKTGNDETFAAPYSVCVEYYLNCSWIILKSISVEAKYCNSWERYGL